MTEVGEAAAPKASRRTKWVLRMITLTRLDGRVIVLNADLIKMIESTPDTIITLVNGDTMIVREPVDDVVEKSIDYARQIRAFRVV